MPYKDKEVAKQKAHERYMKNREEILRKQRNLKFDDPEKYKKLREQQKKARNKYYHKNKDKIKKRRKELYIINKLKREYNLTLEDYNRMYEEQGKVCAICNKIDNSNVRSALPLVIDHNHNSDNVRGLLCHSCNKLLGMAYENICILKNAIIYLEKYNE